MGSSYCSNDPVDGYDPSGMSEFQDNYMLAKKKYLARWGSGKQDEYKYSRYPSKNFGSGKQEEYYYSHNPVQRVLYNAYQAVRHAPITHTQGLSISAGFYSASISLSMDTKGNIVPQVTFTSNLSTNGFLNWSLGAYITETNAPSALDLQGLGIQYGGSVSGSVEGVPIFIGLDGNKVIGLQWLYSFNRRILFSWC